MRLTVIKCDRCGKEIEGNPIRLVPRYVEREGGCYTLNKEAPHAETQKEKEYCEDCIEKILAKANGLTIKKEFEDAVRKMEKEVSKKREKKTEPTEQTVKTKGHGGSKQKLDMTEVMKMKAAGFTNKEIADKFGSTPGAVSVKVCKERKKQAEQTKEQTNEQSEEQKYLAYMMEGKTLKEIGSLVGKSEVYIHSMMTDYKSSVMDGKIKDEEAYSFFEKQMIAKLDKGKLKALSEAHWTLKDMALEFQVTKEIIKKAIIEERKSGNIC